MVLPCALDHGIKMSRFGRDDEILILEYSQILALTLSPLVGLKFVHFNKIIKCCLLVFAFT